MVTNTLGRYKGTLLGLAIGDAIGTATEFKRRGTFEPITDMTGGGMFDLEPGQWTDDTSMALCLGQSLIDCSGFDAGDQMRKYEQWRSQGYMSSNGKCFDIGVTVSDALDTFRISGNPFAGSTDRKRAGNGCLMRLAPVVMYYHPNREAVETYNAISSRTTHGAYECFQASKIFGLMLAAALDGKDKAQILTAAESVRTGSRGLNAIIAGKYQDKTADDIVGSGYVVESLEAALWCFHSTDNYRDAILCAANLGDDADTTAAIAGQVAGAHYSVGGIPQDWKKTVAWSDKIIAMADTLYLPDTPPTENGEY